MTKKERDRVSALCHLAWHELLANRSRMLSVSLDDALLLRKAGAKREFFGRSKGKQRVELDLYGHIFVHEDEYYFYIPA